MYQKKFSGVYLFVAILVFSALMMINGTAHAQSGIIEQCANGDPETDPTCTSSGSTGWVNGNVNGGKATYTLGDYVAYRQILTDLTVGYTYCFGFGWDTNINGEPAIDYIGTFNNTITQADPTHGYTQFTVGSPDETVAIPADPALTATMAGESFTGLQSAGVITTWGTSGFTINGYSNDGSADLNSASTYQQSLEYCFTATDTVAILAWGGHVALPSEWGDLPRPTGSPYHMSQGTRQGYFTAPRTSVTDLVCISDQGVITHNNEGRKETQLQISDPTAISLANFTAAGEQPGIWTIGSVIGILLVVTSLIIVKRKSLFTAG